MRSQRNSVCANDGAHIFSVGQKTYYAPSSYTHTHSLIFIKQVFPLYKVRYIAVLSLIYRQVVKINLSTKLLFFNTPPKYTCECMIFYFFFIYLQKMYAARTSKYHPHTNIRIYMHGMTSIQKVCFMMKERINSHEVQKVTWNLVFFYSFFK